MLCMFKRIQFYSFMLCKKVIYQGLRAQTFWEKLTFKSEYGPRFKSWRMKLG